MSMRFRIASFVAALLVLPLLLISTNTRHQVMASPMPEMMHQSTKISDCASVCGSQQQPTVTAINQREVEKDKEPKPAPAEPYYLQFLQFAPFIVLISAAYLLRYLRWRPPDIIKLNAAYRF